MSAIGDVLVWLLIFALYVAAVRVHERFFTEEVPSTQLFCPRRDDRVPIAEDYRENVVWDDGVSCYGYGCEVCGNVHTWDFGIAPAPIYQGDRIRFRLTPEGMVQAEPDAA